ncbi:DUF2971 domain-containing protein [Catenovulum adriaticum]|uniref:DUF2971 domain-containing protein n=1 Tax=Catenovulum adriaticum TaxID=2984846 RepID=A0ABY7ATW1_9ALTE|nr:DUF2971 domain-containing protein [Catenovulum sp. TS8]WAJ72207.1 DUF2971 domain-containing protein [Catenovulum sp. TS8]
MDNKIIEFTERHISAHESGFDGLFRFLSFSNTPESIDKHKAMLTDGWLYHTTPESLNDPHDIKFKLKWPGLDDWDEISGFIEDIKLMRSLSGNLFNEKLSSIQSLLGDDSLKIKLEAALKQSYSQTRVCCFTTSHKNILFWAHYANSHTGYCIKFKVNDNPKSIFTNTRKIHYSNDYPTIKFPVFSNLVSLLSIILKKAKNWEYEDEYRSMFSPNWPLQLENNGSSLSLRNDDISDIYFGMNMKEEDKTKIIELVEAGPFNPNYWDTRICKDSFSLDFIKHDP